MAFSKQCTLPTWVHCFLELPWAVGGSSNHRKSNRGIGEELVISEGTARRHVSNIYPKISANNRSEATSYALREGLVSSELCNLCCSSEIVYEKDSPRVAALLRAQ